MHFSFLLTALLFALAQVEAAPVKRSSRMVTLSLKRLPQSSDVPPNILLQQHINRSHRRHARMNGLEGPSDAELVKRLQKRLSQANFPNYGKRYNRIGVDKVSTFTDDAVSFKGGNKHNQKGNGSLNGNPDNNSTNVPNNNQNTTASGQGFPQSKLDAQNVDGLTPADTPTTANSLGLDIEGADVGYIATIQAGTPPQNFSILMDSGSADFWIGAEGCQTSQSGSSQPGSSQTGALQPDSSQPGSSQSNGCGNHVFLGPQGSSSFQDSNQTFQVTYGTGQVEGNIIADNVNIAGLALDQHVFGVALLESSDFSSDTTKFDGLMGLAQSTLSEQGVLTPVESLAQNGLISEAITSYKLGRVSDGNNDGEITFGGLDQSKFDPNTLATFPNVNQNGFWEGAVSASVNGNDLGLQGRTAILDTGTTLMVLPTADAEAVHAQIPGSQSDGQGGFTIPCTSNAVVSLTFGGQAFDINPSDLLFSPVDANNLQGDCISGISAGQVGGATQWLVGDVFLKNAYYSTNVGKNEISLATLV